MQLLAVVTGFEVQQRARVLAEVAHFRRPGLAEDVRHVVLPQEPHRHGVRKAVAPDGAEPRDLLGLEPRERLGVLLDALRQDQRLRIGHSASSGSPEMSARSQSRASTNTSSA
ncbi:hypothetical protein D9M72_652660 [compost metagenome]